MISVVVLWSERENKAMFLNAKYWDDITDQHRTQVNELSKSIGLALNQCGPGPRV